MWLYLSIRIFNATIKYQINTKVNPVIHKSTRLPFSNRSGTLTVYSIMAFYIQEGVVGFWKATSTV